MAEMVASALVQEGVSGALSLVVSHREEKASQGHLMERLEMAHSRLEFALERSSKMPITDVSLLRIRKNLLKPIFQECTAVLHKHKLPAGDEEAEHATVPVSSSLLWKTIMHAVLPSAWSFSRPNKDLLTRSDVGRFEWFAEKADSFVRDVESGCSLLARYRFSNPIVTQLLEGKQLLYSWTQGINRLSILTSRTEEHGVMASLWFRYGDPEAGTNSFSLGLCLRLSESTNIVGISTKCVQSLGPNFKYLAPVAAGQLAYQSTQVVGVQNHDLLPYPGFEDLVRLCRPDPVCCITSGLNKSCTSNTISSELTGRFPEEVTWVGADINLRRSTKQVYRKTVKAWPYLELTADFCPHTDVQLGGAEVSSLHHMEETIHAEAINFFSCQPEQTKYSVGWFSAHGAALFKVSKPTVDTRCAPRAMTRRESKRKR